jgi:hypothetical protein
MEYHLEKKIAFNGNTKHSSLYGFCLNEIDTNGEKDGRDLIPFHWSLYFTGSSLQFVRDVGKEKQYDENNEEIPTTIFKKTNAIVGVFHSGIFRDGPFLTDKVSFSMMGTDRKIKDFSVYIVESSDETEDCKIIGIPSYDYDIDFRHDTEQDFLQLHISLRPDKFAKIAEAVEAKKVDSATLMISRVSGFYSDWSPSIFTDFIKVLTDSHKIDGTDDSFKIPFLVGEVGSFRLTLNTLNRLNVKPDSQKFDFEKTIKETELDPEYLDAVAKQAEQLKEESRARLVTDTAASIHLMVDKAIGKLKWPLWFIFGVLVLILLK